MYVVIIILSNENMITTINKISYFGSRVCGNTPTPNQNENAKTTAPSNFDAEAFGDMFSTLYNRI